MPIVVADNVCEYLYAGTDQEEWDLTEDFPTLAPPFPLFWLEMRRPSKLVSTEYGERSSRLMPYAWGYVIEAIAPATVADTLAAELARGEIGPLRRMVEGSAAFLQAGIQQKWAAAQPDVARFWASLDGAEQGLLVNTEMLRQVVDQQQARWIMRADLWAEPEKGRIIGPLVNHTFMLDGQGQCLMAPLFHLYMTDGALAYRDTLTPLLDSFSTAIFPACLALSFFHCKNVTVRDEAPPQALAKAHLRRHGVPLLRYKTLDIYPMQRVLHQAGAGTPGGVRKALHICRGHFKDYRQKGLFGTRFGVYWWDMHLRGHRDAGLVVKDYAVHPHEEG
jgi:hypothetical protein